VAPRPSLAKRASSAVTGLGGFISALVAIVAGTLALLGYLKRDDPPPPTPAATSGGKVTGVTLSTLSFGDWIRQQGDSPSSFSSERQRAPGVLVDYRVTLDGYVGKELPVHWRVKDDRGRTLDHKENSALVPVALTDTNSKQFWAQVPPDVKNVRVEIEIHQPGDAGLLVTGCGLATFATSAQGGGSWRSSDC
jgi:hypothetical protein